jgi:hypothetical protein
MSALTLATSPRLDGSPDHPRAHPSSSAGEGGLRVSEDRERGATGQNRPPAFLTVASPSEAGFPSPDPLRGPPSSAEGGGIRPSRKSPEHV